tara:strand:- start:39852 stop:40328 length:477 start_codon:yes stop_codon:yes gene_type:complete
MKNNDLIQVVYTPEEQEACNTGIVAVETFAAKHVLNLSAEDRQNLGSINETNKLFVNKTKTLMEQNPSMVPVFINQEEYNRDLVAREEIEKLILKLDTIKRNLSDTKILLDHDNYHDALAFYRSVRYLAKEHQSGAIAVYEELKQYFPSKKKEKESAL